MNTPLLSLTRISTNLQGQKILDDISLSINTGQHLALIGKSGSGKSSLLKVITGKQRLSGGFITYNFDRQKQTESIEPLKSQQIVFVESRHHFKNFSNTTDFYYQQRYNSSDSEDSLTIEQYLKSVSSKVEKNQYWDLEKVIDSLYLTDLCNERIIKLSNGETKRLRIAAALIKNPKLLLLDEPLTGLDAGYRQHFNLLLQEISSSGITIIIATSPGEIPDVVQQVAVLENGKLTQTLNPIDVKTADFLRAENTGQTDAEEIGILLRSARPQTFNYVVKMTAVNVQYGNVTVLKNISWIVKQGERWALSGPNGSGKSTLLSLIYGDNPQAYSNNITLFDKKRGTGETIWDIKSKCGFVSPELFQYFPTDNNCLQIVESGFYDTLGLFRKSDTSRAALALKWMELLAIDKFAGHMLKNIPTGAQRLCLLARAIIKNPVLLILDEPCQGMDEQQVKLFNNIVDIICSKTNITLIYVTHYHYEMPKMVDRYLKLDKGEVAYTKNLST